MRSRIRIKEVNRPNAPFLQSKQKWHCSGPGMLRGHWLRLTVRRNAISGRPLAKLTVRIHCMAVGILNISRITSLLVQLGIGRLFGGCLWLHEVV